MAKATRSRLTEVRVRTATAGDAKHGRQLFDGLGSNGLYLHVTPAGAKCWVQQLMVPNAATGKSRRVRIGLGAWPRVTLAEARKAAFANRCLRDEGRDPLAAKRQRAHETAKEARVPTFAGAIDEVIALRRPTWKEADTLAGQFRASLERYAGALGPIQVSRIATADVMQALAPHWHSVPAAAGVIAIEDSREAAQGGLGSAAGATGMCPRETLPPTPWRDDHPWPSLIEHVAQAQQPQGMVPESWVAGLQECVRSGYVDRPDSVIPVADSSYLRKVARTVMAMPEDQGLLEFGVFVAWCCDLRQGAMRDFPEVDTRGDRNPEVTMLARCLDIALAAPSWLSGCHPRVRRLLVEEVQGRLVSEVPDLVARVEALRTWMPDSHSMPSWCDAMALAAVRQWQDDVLDEVEGMGAKSLLWYRVLTAWRLARAVTDQPVPQRVVRWLETTVAPQGTAGALAKMALAGWRSIRLIHGLRQSFDGRRVLRDNASEASEYHGAIGVAAVLLDLGWRQVEGYWRRREEQCQGWPLRQPIPFKLLFFANDP